MRRPRPIDSLPTTLTEARARLNGKEARTIANNTTLEDYGEYVAIRLHATQIVRFYETGAIEFNSGGYHTVTTKQRLNVVLRAHGRTLSQKAYRWYVYEIGQWDRPITEWCDGYTLAPCNLP